MLTAVLSAWSLVRRHWQLALGLAAVVALAIWRALLLRQGRTQERQAQAERNRQTKERADAARDDALRSGDPRRDLLRDFRRADER